MAGREQRDEAVGARYVGSLKKNAIARRRRKRLRRGEEAGRWRRSWRRSWGSAVEEWIVVRMFKTWVDD